MKHQKLRVKEVLWDGLTEPLWCPRAGACLRTLIVLGTRMKMFPELSIQWKYLPFLVRPPPLQGHAATTYANDGIGFRVLKLSPVHQLVGQDAGENCGEWDGVGEGGRSMCCSCCESDTRWCDIPFENICYSDSIITQRLHSTLNKRVNVFAIVSSLKETT